MLSVDVNKTEAWYATHSKLPNDIKKVQDDNAVSEITQLCKNNPCKYVSLVYEKYFI